MSNNTEYIQEDEIDLRELFKTIWDKKVFIAVFTTIITLASIVFVLSKTPIYEAKVLVEIGSYKLYYNNSNSNSRVLIDDVNQLSKKLNILFIETKKNVKEKESEIINITVPKGQTTFIEITSNALNNKLATKEIKGVIEYIRNKHQIILDDVRDRRELKINNIDRKISNIKKNEIKILDDKISLQQETINQYSNQLKQIDKNLRKIENSNPSLAALKLMEKRDLSNFILNSNIQLMDNKNKKDELITTTLTELEEEKNLIKSLLLAHNYKNSEIVGQIITNDYPIKPKKKLIVVVSFVTAFILSIFLVFFMQFIRSMKEDKV